MKKQIFYWSLVSALAGFIFGFDTGVFSGAGKTIQSIWGGWVPGCMVSALYGNVLGLLTMFFPKMVTSFPPGWVFLFFCSMMVRQLVWVKYMVPETKGVPLEDLASRLKWGRT